MKKKKSGSKWEQNNPFESDFAIAEAEESFGFSEDEIHLLSELKAKKKE